MNLINPNPRVSRVALTIFSVVMFGALVHHAFLGEEARTYLWPAPWNLLWIGLFAVAGGFLALWLQRVPFAKRRPYILICETVLAGACATLAVMLLRPAAILDSLVVLGCLGIILGRLYGTWKRVE